MDHCSTETLQPTNQFKMADRLTKSSLGVAQHFSVLVFPLRKFRNFILRKKARVYLLTEIKKALKNLASLQKQLNHVRCSCSGGAKIAFVLDTLIIQTFWIHLITFGTQ